MTTTTEFFEINEIENENEKKTEDNTICPGKGCIDLFGLEKKAGDHAE
jgi:hypothetical protein